MRKCREGIETAFRRNIHEGENLEKAIILREWILLSGSHLKMPNIIGRDIVDNREQSFREAAIFRLCIRSQEKRQILKGWGRGREEIITVVKDNI